MRHPHIDQAIEISDLPILGGQMVTLWLTLLPKAGKPMAIHMRHDGTREIFVDGDVSIRPYNERPRT